MRRIPWVTAFLNLVMPGLGFMYLGTVRFVVAGIIVCFAYLSILAVVMVLGVSGRVRVTIHDGLSGFYVGAVLAVVGYVATRRLNESLQD